MPQLDAETGEESWRERPRVGARVSPPHPVQGSLTPRFPVAQFVPQIVGGNMVGSRACARRAVGQKRIDFESPKRLSGTVLIRFLPDVLPTRFDRRRPATLPAATRPR